MPAEPESNAPEPAPDVIIVGAGAAGLSCAHDLVAAGRSVLTLEASDQVGGRMRSDRIDGFVLDRGFQTLLTAYEECQVRLDYESLELGCFEPGAMIWTGRRLSILADPFRLPGLALHTAFNPLAAFKDKLKVAALRSALHSRSPEDLFNEDEESTAKRLRRLGFSRDLVDRFFRPFFGGIFLERELATTSRMFDFVYKMFGQGYAALPAEGIQAIPEQLAASLPRSALRLRAKVVRAEPERVELATGEVLPARAVILATDAADAAKLAPDAKDRGWNGTRCYYFAAKQSPLPRPMIALNGSGRGNIANVVVLSDAQPRYAPKGQCLVCVNAPAEGEFDEKSIRAELEGWLGPEVRDYRFLRSYEIQRALPRQESGDCAFEAASTRLPDGLWVCGDHLHSSSIHGAMRSGRKTARAVARHLDRMDASQRAERRLRG